MATNNFYNEGITGITGAALKGRLNYMVEMPIEYLHFNFGGETRVYTLNQLMLLGHCDILSDSDNIL